ncbi:hypothetical protein L227DRAFT_613331 [Lentinus tigrinus ALCF2SS1-6]|uniref:Uncharacterized protein n=1 Tax=Lentinus tigrinus ALCF2SS1-6 TaxID=1328759 RepID=A0A5C2S4R9_9APHY|nr:hypothetical protein L227DRAFT_613331 [Lentinus tigrinus ALCF2SS1-6]
MPTGKVGRVSKTLSQLGREEEEARGEAPAENQFRSANDPVWRRGYIWLVAKPFTSDGCVVDRWRWKNAQGEREDDKGFRVEEEARIELQTIIDFKIDEWIDACLEDTEYFQQCKEEYKIFKNPEAWKRHLAKLQAQRYLQDAKKAAAEEAATKSEATAQTNSSSDPAASATRHVASSTALAGVPDTPLVSEPTLTGSSPTGSKKDSTNAPGPQTSTNSTSRRTGNGDTQTADGDTSAWNIVQRRKNKSKKHTDRQRTTSTGLGSRLAGLVGVKKGRQS